jgi:hypothetical protein
MVNNCLNEPSIAGVEYKYKITENSEKGGQRVIHL